jgi:hypothetical protein
MDIWHIARHDIIMIIRTRVFDMASSRYHNLSDLARAMGLSVSQVYRVREGKRGINEKFIVGAKRAFPECHLDELFYFNPEPSPRAMAETTAGRYDHIVRRMTAADPLLKA